MIYFEFDSTKITEISNGTIKKAIELAKVIRAKRVYVSGHTNRAGTGNYNMDLSEKRAEIVVGQLTGGGLSSRMVSFGSFGENVLAVMTKDGMRSVDNRRVEIQIAN